MNQNEKNTRLKFSLALLLCYCPADNTIMFPNTSHNISDKSVEDCYKTYVVLSPSTSYIINSVVGCVVNAIFTVTGTFLNALVVCVFWKTPKLRQKVSYFMIMVLSSIDMCVSIIVHPFHLVNSIAEITETSKCSYKMLYQLSAVVFSGMSFLTFFVMNMERYLSIVHPFFHLKHVTKYRCLVLSSLFWVVCITTGIAPLLKQDIQMFVTVLALIVIIGTFIIYVSIFYVARKRHHSKPRSTSTSQQDPVVVDPPSGPEANDSKKTVPFLHDLQLAKMYLLVVFCTFFCNLPNAIVLGKFTERIKTLDGIVQVKIWTVTLVAMNSTLNCLIFFWANKRLRNEGRKICKEFLKR